MKLRPLAFLCLLAPTLLIGQESASDLAAERGLNPGTTDTNQSARELADQEGLGSKSIPADESAAQLADETGGAISPKDSEESAGQLATDRLGMDPTPTPTPAASAASGPQGVNGVIYAAAVQTDGKIIIGGEFNEVGITPRKNLARLNSDGTLDTSFLAGSTDGVNGTVFALAIDAKGGILVGGMFNQANETEQRNFVRFLPTGKLDTSFGSTNGPNGKVLAIAVQPDGTIVIGGEFNQVNGQERRNLAQFSATGTLADALSPGLSGSIRSIVVLPDGTIFAGGEFENTHGGRNIYRSGK